MTFAYTFEWDARKAAANRRKHGISFAQATAVFRDRLMVSIPDEEHSEQEERWVTLGHADDGRLLVVIHTFHEDEHRAVVRLISAREVTRHERQQYEERL